ncbi:DUF368 domain-containing protein [Candidatus Halobeggiatoa sp. HSG11]|nr:DUF368 domain-containing protein [Candidatus Halobeggiatoa sp. HSG11]
MKEKINLAVKGFCMGTADVVPGVSGGTMAFILGIYAQLLAAIRSFDLIWLKYIFKLQIKPAIQRPHFNFLLPLFVGIVCALLFFTRIVPLPVFLHTHPEIVYGLFFGLIVASIIVLLPEIKPLNLSKIFSLLAGIILGWLIVTLVPMNTPDTTSFIFFSGMLAISAMLLPGISGSFILLILHKYDTILNAIGHFNFMILIPFGFGVVAGLVFFSRVISWLLASFYHHTVAIIIGILIGSLWIIWPFQVRQYITVHNKERLISSTPYWPEAWNDTVMYSILMMFIGLGLVLIIYAWSERKT